MAQCLAAERNQTQKHKHVNYVSKLQTLLKQIKHLIHFSYRVVIRFHHFWFLTCLLFSHYSILDQSDCHERTLATAADQMPLMLTALCCLLLMLVRMPLQIVNRCCSGFTVSGSM